MYRKQHKAAPHLRCKAGCPTGPVVADIVGVKKFAYDIWGDTVNIASRMESSGEVGQVNISESTYALVKDADIAEDGVASTQRVDPNRVGDGKGGSGTPGFTFTPRGKVQAKGKGEMEMYFVRASWNDTGFRCAQH
jgi:adenylate cyclase